MDCFASPIVLTTSAVAPRLGQGLVKQRVMQTEQFCRVTKWTGWNTSARAGMERMAQASAGTSPRPAVLDSGPCH